MYYGPYVVSSSSGDKAYRFILDAAQAWANEEAAIVLDSNGEAIPNSILEDIIS